MGETPPPFVHNVDLVRQVRLSQSGFAAQCSATGAGDSGCVIAVDDEREKVIKVKDF